MSENEAQPDASLSRIRSTENWDAGSDVVKERNER